MTFCSIRPRNQQRTAFTREITHGQTYRSNTQEASPRANSVNPESVAIPWTPQARAVDAKAAGHTQAVNAGRMSKSEEAKIDAKANRKLGKKS